MGLEYFNEALTLGHKEKSIFVLSNNLEKSCALVFMFY